jgi:hypothetical protein
MEQTYQNLYAMRTFPNLFVFSVINISSLFSVEMSEGKKDLDRLDDNIKMDLREIGLGI